MLFTVVWSQVSSAGQISGELKKWHKVTLTFNGPETSETAKPNPFLYYRLNVTLMARSFRARTGRHLEVQRLI